MAGIVIGIILGIVSIVLVFASIFCASNQLVMYDREHSNLKMASIEMLEEKIRALTRFGVSDVTVEGNSIYVVANKVKHHVVNENGLVYIVYDIPSNFVTIRFQIFWLAGRYRKCAKKAAIINQIVEEVAGEKNRTSAKKLSATNALTTFSLISFIAMVAALIIGAVTIGMNTQNQAIDKVKNSIYKDNKTYGQIIDKYLVDEKWDTFLNNSDTAVVEVEGTDKSGNKYCIQFIGEASMKFNNADRQVYTPYYMGINEQGYEIDSVLDIMVESEGN